MPVILNFMWIFFRPQGEKDPLGFTRLALCACGSAVLQALRYKCDMLQCLYANTRAYTPCTPVTTTPGHDSMPIASRRLVALAERDPRRAVRLAQRALDRISSDDPLNSAWARYSVGWALLCWERPSQARPYLQDARKLFAPQEFGELRCCHALLIADQIELARADLAQDFATLAQAFMQAGAVAESARVALNQARLLNVLGRAGDAENVLRAIVPILCAGTPLDRARLLRVQGVVANLRNNFAEATELLARAEQAFRKLNNQLERAKCWFEQAWVALRQEHVAQALVGYRRAEHLFIQLDLPLQCAFCAKNIGLLLTRLGRYDAALHALLIALHSFTRLNRTRDVGGCLLNIGNIYFYAAQWEPALACYDRAAAHYAATGVVGELYTIQRNRAMIYRAQGRHDEAQAVLLEVERHAHAAGDQAEQAEVWAELAASMADTGQSAAAIQLYQRAQQQFTQLDSMLDAAECAVELGWLALREGAVEHAGAFFQAALPVVSAHPYYSWRAGYGLARCCEAHGDLSQALRHYRTASRTIATLRRRLASEEISSGLYAQAAQLHADALRLAIAHGAIEAALEISEEQRALVLQHLIATRAAGLPEDDPAAHAMVRSAIAHLLRANTTGGTAGAALDAALASYGEQLVYTGQPCSPELVPATATESTFDLARLRAQLNQAHGEEWTAITYIISGETLLIGVVTPAQASYTPTAYDAQLQRLLARASYPAYRRLTYLDLAFLQGQTQAAWASLSELAERLIPMAVQARLHAQHRLLIVPVGPLHALPWAALRIDGSWLAERAIIQLAPALATWKREASQLPDGRSSALLVGCSAYGTRDRALPAVRAELAAIAAHWPGSCEQLYDADATCAALLQRSDAGQLARLKLLHIAGHAQLLPSRGRSAHLKLWDGDLLLADLVDLDLRNVLVVLSACNGAAAEALPGEELLGLSWAFLAAGASGVLASLWPIDDGEAVPLMTAFYQELRRHGDAALGLALMQRRMMLADPIAGDAPTMPLYWGSLVFTGRS